MNRRRALDVLWMILDDAKSWNESIIDAWGGDEKGEAVRDAQANIRIIERFQIKYFGSAKTIAEAEADKLKPVSIDQIFKLAEEHPELFNWIEDKES